MADGRPTDASLGAGATASRPSSTGTSSKSLGFEVSNVKSGVPHFRETAPTAPAEGRHGGRQGVGRLLVERPVQVTEYLQGILVGASGTSRATCFRLRIRTISSRWCSTASSTFRKLRATSVTERVLIRSKYLIGQTECRHHLRRASIAADGGRAMNPGLRSNISSALAGERHPRARLACVRRSSSRRRGYDIWRGSGGRRDQRPVATPERRLPRRDRR